MENNNLEKLKEFYEDIIKGWMMQDLRVVKDISANFITALGCLTFTEAIGLYLPELDKSIEKDICNDKQKRFYRCLFALESKEHLIECDKKIRKITKGNGIYQLRNKISHKYIPNLVIPGIIPIEVRVITVGVRGSHNPPALLFPIFLEENLGKIEKVVMNNEKYIEELQKLVEDVYNKTFIKKDSVFINSMRSGYQKLSEND